MGDDDWARLDAAWTGEASKAGKKKRSAVFDEAALEADVFGGSAGRGDDDDEAAAAAAAAGGASGPGGGGAAWTDEDDALAVDIRSASRLKKLRKTEKDRVIDGGELEARLRERFAAGGGAAWAVDRTPDDLGESDLARAARSMEEDGGEGELRVERQADANAKLPAKAAIQCVGFHPTLDLLFCAGFDKTVRFFHVDGDRNALASQLHVADLPVHGGAFLASRASDAVAVFSGRRPFYYRYDVQAEAGVKVMARPRSKDKSLERFAASPDGALLAFTGHDGNVLLSDARRGCWLPDELKMSGTARAVAFGPADSHVLYSGGGDADVYVWDLRKTANCVDKFADAGASPTSALVAAPSMTTGHSLHVASESGVVNSYDRGANAVDAHPGFGFSRAAAAAPKRAVLSLTTTVDSMAASDKVVVFASKWAKDALRVLHLPSLRVAPNWPTSKTPLHYVSALALNHDSSFLAIGNDRGKVLLYKLKNFA